MTNRSGSIKSVWDVTVSYVFCVDGMAGFQDKRVSDSRKMRYNIGGIKTVKITEKQYRNQKNQRNQRHRKE